VLGEGLQQALEMAWDTRTSLDDLNKLATALAKLEPLDYGLANALKIEYSMASGAIDEICGSLNYEKMNTLTGISIPKLLHRKRMPKYFFQPNKTKAVFAKTYRNFILNTSRIYADIDLDASENFGIEKNKFFFIIKPNAVGKIIFSLLRLNYNSMLEKKCKMESMITAAYLVTELRIYEIKNGTLPDKLDLMVPEYIKEIPIDTYDGKSFRYNKTNATVYSVGRDLKDSRGSTNLIISIKHTRIKDTEDHVYSIRKNH
jgi:hypothetical protein